MSSTPPPPPPPPIGLVRSDPLRTVSDPSGTHGHGLVVASRPATMKVPAMSRGVSDVSTTAVVSSTDSGASSSGLARTHPSSDPLMNPPPAPAGPAGPAPALPPGGPSTIVNVTSPSDKPTSPSSASYPPRTATTLEDEVDLFLSSASLRPPALLTSDQGLLRVRSMVSRRAWGDVLHLTGEYLNSSSKPYQPFYSQLLSSKNNNNVHNNNNNNVDHLHNNHNNKNNQLGTDPLLHRLQTETAHLVAYKLHAMLKLRRYADLAREVDRLNLVPCTKDDNDDTAYPLPQWVPYGLEILAAESLQYTDNAQKCVDTLSVMRRDLSTSSSESSSSQRWLPWINVALANACMRIQEWRPALDAFDKVYASLPDNVERDVTDLLQSDETTVTDLLHDDSEVEVVAMTTDPSHVLLSEILLATLRIEILSRQLRIFLQSGAVAQARALQTRAQKQYATYQASRSRLDASDDTTRARLQDHVLVQQVPTQMLLNDGLVFFSLSQYTAALDRFTQALAVQRECPLPQVDQSGPTHDALRDGGATHALRADPFLLTHALNNIALCALYTCKVEYAVELLEGLVKENPTRFLTEVLVFNMCTLYELGADEAGSRKKKTVLQGVAKRFFLHDIGSENFRISGSGTTT